MWDLQPKPGRMRSSSFILAIRASPIMSLEPKGGSRPQTGAPPDPALSDLPTLTEFDALPLEIKAQVIREVTTTVSMTGPLPPPDIAREYEEICPGFVDRSLQMAEKAQEAAIEAAQDERRKNQFYRLFGMVCAATLSLSLIVAGCVIAIYVNVYVGAFTALASFIGSVVVAFINGRPLRDSSSPEGLAGAERREEHVKRSNQKSPARKKRR